MSGELTLGKHNWMEFKDIVSQVPMPFENEIFLEEMEVSGTMDIDDIIVKSEALKYGDFLTLKRETSNEFDEHAIQIETVSGVKLGYVPARWNAILSRLMDAGKCLVAKVYEKDLIDDFYMRIMIGIYLKEF